MAVEQLDKQSDIQLERRSETQMETSSGCYSLQRFPVRKKETLRAWDAADEYILDYLAKNDLLHQGLSLLILNDAFGGLSIPLNQYQPVLMTDSYLSMQAISLNLKDNDIDYDSITIINSLETPDSVLNDGPGSGRADIVLLKVPKSLAMLEDQLHRIRSSLCSSTIIIAAGMTKNIHTSTLDLFKRIIGPTTTSQAHKKSRLIFSQFDADLSAPENPHPGKYKLGYQLDDAELEIINHAAVFSREKLDIGTRLFIENLPVDEKYKTIVDLGCGNGVLGLLAAIKNPSSKLIFTDESYMAVESSINNFLAIFGETREAEFLQTDCLHGVPENSVSLILCNPPFHQNNTINDAIAWQMFTESKAALEEQGELWVIGNRHLAYHAKLKHLFGFCDVVASNNKFTLLKSIKK